MMVSHPPMERVIQLLRTRLDPPIRQVGELSRTVHAYDDRFDHPPAGKAHDVADDKIQLDVGFLERLPRAARHLLAETR